MNNKIALIYDGSNYQIVINEKVIMTVEKIEDAYRCFEKTIHNNKSTATVSWETISSQVKQLELSEVEIFEDYHAIGYKTIKYFHNTGKLFYMNQGQMFPLNGDYRLLLFILERVVKKQLDESEGFIEICAKAMAEGIVYHIKEDTFSLYSAIFNYGNVTYNFLTKEIHKGTHTENGTFNVFKEYVLDIIAPRA